MCPDTSPQPKNGPGRATAAAFANMLRPFDERSEADRPFVPLAGGPRLYVLLLYASVLVAVSIEFFASTRTWYGSWWIYNAYVLIVTSVFVFLGMIMLFSSTRRGPEDQRPPLPRFLLATLGLVLLSLSGLALVLWGKDLGAWAIALSITLLYGFLMVVLGSRTITRHDSLRLLGFGTGVVLMVLVPVHEAFGVYRTTGTFFLYTLSNLALLAIGMVLALISLQSLQTRDGYLGSWLMGTMVIFLISFHEQIGIVASHTYSEYDRTLAFLGVIISFLPLGLYIWRERIYIFLWRRMRSANALIESGDYHEALKQADAAIRQCARVGIEDRFALPWTLKSDALYRMKDYQKAMVHYDTALSIDPNDSTSWCHMGNMYAFEGKKEEALKAYDKALKSDPKNPFAWNNKGAVFQQMGRDEDALICFDKAIQFSPRMFDAHLNMARLFSKMGHATDALEHYQIALDINPASEAAKEGVQREHYRSLCLDQIHGWEQLGLDTTYLRSLVDQEPRDFARKSKEFLAKIVDQNAEIAVQPGMEHIDVNKAISQILKVTEGEGATIDQIVEATNLRRHDLVLPLALLMETDHLHFRSLDGTEVYVSKGKAPEKPQDMPVLTSIQTVWVEPTEEPVPDLPPPEPRHEPKQPVKAQPKPEIEPEPAPEPPPEEKKEVEPEIEQEVEPAPPEPPPKAVVKRKEPVPPPTKPEPKPEPRTEPKLDKKAQKAEKAKEKAEKKAEKRAEKEEKKEKKEKLAAKAPKPPQEKSKAEPEPEPEPPHIRREVVKVEPTASILFFRRTPKKKK